MGSPSLCKSKHPSQGTRCSLTSHTHTRMLGDCNTVPGARAAAPVSLQALASPLRAPPRWVHLQESCILAKTALILISSFYGGRRDAFNMSRLCSVVTSSEVKQETCPVKGGPSTAPRHRTSCLTKLRGVLAVSGPCAAFCHFSSLHPSAGGNRATPPASQAPCSVLHVDCCGSSHKPVRLTLLPCSLSAPEIYVRPDEISCFIRPKTD